MKKKSPIPLSQKFPNIDPLALRLLDSLIAFDPKDRPSAEEALEHPYFHGLANKDHEPSARPISNFEFDFERRKLAKKDIRELIYREILEYHPQMLQEYLHGTEHTSFLYPSGADCFKEQFDLLEGHYALHPRRYASLPRERVCVSIDEDGDFGRHVEAAVSHKFLERRRGSHKVNNADSSNENDGLSQSELSPTSNTARCLIRSASISFSKCVGAVWEDREDFEELDSHYVRGEQKQMTDSFNCMEWLKMRSYINVILFQDVVMKLNMRLEYLLLIMKRWSYHYIEFSNVLMSTKP